MSFAYLCSNPTFSLHDASGYATHIHELNAFLESKTGSGVDILLPSVLANKHETSTSHKVVPKKHWARDFFPRSIWNTAKELRRLRQDKTFAQLCQQRLRQNPPKLIFERLDYPGPLMPTLSLDIPWVLEIHAPVIEEAELLFSGLTLKTAYQNRLQRGLQQCHKITVVSGALKQWLIEKGVSSEKIVVVHNGFNPASFPMAESKPAKEKLMLGYLGSSLPWHGIDRIIKAFAAFSDNLDLSIVGSAHANRSLRNLATNLGVDQRIHWIKPVNHDQVAKQIASFDIAILGNANWYQNPVKLFEYAAMKKAIIAPNTAPIAEVFTNHKDALLFDDEPGLKAALKKLIENPSARLALAENAYTLMYEKYTWAKQADILYAQVVLPCLQD